MTAQEYVVTIEIRCTQLPAPGWAGGGTLHLGIQLGKEVTKQTPAGRRNIVFHPEIRVRRHTDGTAIFLGPYTQGSRAERFIYLNWIVLEKGAAIAAPGRIKLHLNHIPWQSIQRAVRAGEPLKVTLALSGARGQPLFASIRADVAQWEL